MTLTSEQLAAVFGGADNESLATSFCNGSALRKYDAAIGTYNANDASSPPVRSFLIREWSKARQGTPDCIQRTLEKLNKGASPDQMTD
jgi:hypothetical protein